MAIYCKKEDNDQKAQKKLFQQSIKSGQLWVNFTFRC